MDRYKKALKLLKIFRKTLEARAKLEADKKENEILKKIALKKINNNLKEMLIIFRDLLRIK